MPEPGGILLAAGAAQRFGASKLLQPLADGTPVGLAAASNLINAVPDVVAVVRPEDRILADLLSDAGLRVIDNPLADQGMATSIVAGVTALPDADGWLIALADMPWISRRTIRTVIETLDNGGSIVAPYHAGQRGHPVALSARWKASLLGLKGDEGARRILKNHPGDVVRVNTSDPGVIRDIDYPGDLNNSSTGENL